MAEIVLLADFLRHGRTFSSTVLPGTTVEPLLVSVLDGGMGTLTATLDEQEGTVRLGGTTLRLVNAPNLLDTFGAAPLLMSPVRLRLGFTTLPLSQYQTLLTGVVEHYQADEAYLDLAVNEPTVQETLNLAMRLGTDAFPDAPEAARGQPIPIYFGVHTHVPGLLVEAGATPTYVLGYGVQRLNRVFVDGVPRTAARLQAVRQTVGVAQVVVVRFADPVDAAALVTAGINAQVPQIPIGGEDLPPPPTPLAPLLINGGFETGDRTGWQRSDGLLIDMLAPERGAYAALVYPVALAEAPYQDVPTTPGMSYEVRLAYRNHRAAAPLAPPNLLSNGSFDAGGVRIFLDGGEVIASGSLHGWTLTLEPGNQPTLTFPSGGPDGSFYLHAEVPLAALSPTSNAFRFEVTQDVPVVVGSTYTFSLYGQSFDVTSGGPVPGGSPPLSVRMTSTVSYRLGTPDAPAAYGAGSLPRLGGTWAQLLPVSVVAQSPTLRVTVVGEGARDVIAQLFPPLGIDGVLVTPASPEPPAQSQAHIGLGTPEDPTRYGDLRPPITLDWGEVLETFTAQTTVTRLTLACDASGTGDVPTAYDSAVLQPTQSVDAVPDIVADQASGENPVDAILFMLRTFRPQSRYDTASFAQARHALRDWKFKGALTDPGDLAQTLQAMTQQCRTWLLRGPDSQYMLPLRSTAQTPVRGFAPDTILRATFQRDSAPLDAVYSSVAVAYHDPSSSAPSADPGSSPWMESQGRPGQALGAVSFCTPTDTSVADDTTLVPLCAAALATYGTAQRLDVPADWIFDRHTAEQLLNFLVQDQTTAHPLCTFGTWLDALPLRLGMRVLADHALLPSGAETGAHLVGTQFDPRTMAVHLTARLQEAIVDLPEVPGYRHIPFDAGVGIFAMGWTNASGEEAEYVQFYVAAYPRGTRQTTLAAFANHVNYEVAWDHLISSVDHADTLDPMSVVLFRDEIAGLLDDDIWIGDSRLPSIRRYHRDGALVGAWTDGPGLASHFVHGGFSHLVEPGGGSILAQTPNLLWVTTDGVLHQWRQFFNPSVPGDEFASVTLPVGCAAARLVSWGSGANLLVLIATSPATGPAAFCSVYLGQYDLFIAEFFRLRTATTGAWDLRDLAGDPNSGVIWAADAATHQAQLWDIDTGFTDTLLTTVPLPEAPVAVAVATDGAAWFAGATTVSRVDAFTLEVLTVEVGAIRRRTAYEDLLTPGPAATMWVVCTDENSVVRVTAAGQTRTVSIPGAPVHLASNLTTYYPGPFLLGVGALESGFWQLAENGDILLQVGPA